jgi:dsRNA-specific ribonuclease
MAAELNKLSGVIYFGIRDASFRDMIKNILEKSKLKQKYIDELTTENNMKIYDQAFTAASANSKKNYEIFEQLGDTSVNKFLVWYAYKRFPQLNCPLGVKVVARIKINYGSRQSFSEIGENLGFWPYITADETERGKKKKDLLEDCVESFFGCTEQILDRKYRPGVGYAIIYDILSSIFDKIDISLNYSDLYDAKTRLKELFDAYKEELGQIAYTDNRDEMLSESIAYQVPRNSQNKPIIIKVNKDVTIEKARPEWIPLGSGKAAKKADAQQKASEEALKRLNAAGWIKEVPAEYKFFCE